MTVNNIVERRQRRGHKYHGKVWDDHVTSLHATDHEALLQRQREYNDRRRHLREHLNDDQKADFRLRHIGIIYQFFNLLPSLTVEENILLPAMILKKNQIQLIGLYQHQEFCPRKQYLQFEELEVH